VSELEQHSLVANVGFRLVSFLASYCIQWWSSSWTSQ